MGIITSSGNTNLKCRGCQSVTVIQPYEFVFDITSTKLELMGLRTCHQAVVGKVCTNCNIDLRVTYSVWEYPSNAHDGTDSRAENAVFMSKTGFRVQ
jgi:hypothetical protein